MRIVSLLTSATEIVCALGFGHNLVGRPCGFDLARTRHETIPLIRRPYWLGLKPARQGHVIAVDGNHYFDRPGPRLAESAGILAEALDPEAFRFGHEGSAWPYL